MCALVSLLLMNAASAQQNACQVDLPVGIIGADGSLLHGLTAQDITIHSRKQTLPVENVAYDTGARRVLFVLDTGRWLPPEARKAETMLVDYILGHARPADTFALLTTRGAVRKVSFDESRDHLTKAIQELAVDPKEPDKAPNVLDTIMEGIRWFGEPHPGDAILIMADHLEGSMSGTSPSVKYQPRTVTGAGPMQGVAQSNVAVEEPSSRVKFGTVTETLADHRIRVFGLQLGGMNYNLTTAYEPGEENLFGIALGSGGYAVLDGTDAYGSYVMTEARAQGLQHKAFQLYGAIAEFYLLRVSAATPPRREAWKLELAKDLRKNTRALYPQWFDPCPSADASRH
jgi:hypothetical protein